MYHLMFDGEPEVRAHVCEGHRRFAAMFECPSDDGSGDCDHVQYAGCDCADVMQCFGCAAVDRKELAQL